MQLLNVMEVCEVTGNPRLVNEYLDAGWVLLNTVKDGEDNHGWFKYCLGWSKDTPPIHPVF